MLALARKIGEEIIIGDDIVVRILSVDGIRVRVGIDASRGIPVDRREVRESKKRGPKCETRTVSTAR